MFDRQTRSLEKYFQTKRSCFLEYFPYPKTTEIREVDLMAVAQEFGIKKPDRVLEQTRSAIADWERFAAAYDVPNGVVKTIRRELDRRYEVLGG